MIFKLVFFVLVVVVVVFFVVVDVNIYIICQFELIQFVMDVFIVEIGIVVNFVYVQDGIVECLQVEGVCLFVDLVMIVDIVNFQKIVDGGVIQVVDSDVLIVLVFVELCSDENLWFVLIICVCIVYVSKDCVVDGEIIIYEDFVSDVWEGCICICLGVYNYNLVLVLVLIEYYGVEYICQWVVDVCENFVCKFEGNDCVQVCVIWVGECDISFGNIYYMGKMLMNEEQQEWVDLVCIVFLIFENGGMYVNVLGVVLIKVVLNKDEVIQLMEFFVLLIVQVIYVEINFEYFVLDGVGVFDMVVVWGMFEVDVIGLDDVVVYCVDVFCLMEEVNFDG